MAKEYFNKEITKLTNGILEVKGLEKGNYDSQAVMYDKLISNGLYNRIMWGNSIKSYSNFCLKGLESNKDGLIIDIACGTLSFTYKAYAKYSSKDLFLCDLSEEMLKIGKKRIEDISDNLYSIKFLRSDALNLPFKENSVETVLNFGLFHIFPEPSLLINEISRILKPNGKVFITSLCTDRKISKKYLNLLFKKGHVAKPLHSTEIIKIIKNNGISIVKTEIIGGMAYISGIKK